MRMRQGNNILKEEFECKDNYKNLFIQKQNEVEKCQNACQRYKTPLLLMLNKCMSIKFNTLDLCFSRKCQISYNSLTREQMLIPTLKKSNQLYLFF